MKIKNEVKTGIVVIIALILFVWGFNYLKGKDIFKAYDTYYVITDNVEGVVKSTPVRLKGIAIGTVDDLKFYNGTNQTMIVLNINDDYVFPKDSKVKVYGGNFMGGKNVAIIPGKSQELAKDGDTLQIMKMPGLADLVNDRLTPLQEKLESIMSSTDTLLFSINNVLNSETQEHLKKSSAELETLIHHFKNSSVQLEELLVNNKEHLNQSFENLDKLSANFAVMSDSLKQIQLGKLVKDLNKSISQINLTLNKLNSGDGTAAKLINDKKLYENLERSTKELELLLKDLREHPKRYVHFSIWGKKDKKDKK